MIDITHKSNTLRQAIATAIVKVSHIDTINAIKNSKVPKGDVLEMAKVAGLFGVKKTAELIPDCHPLPIEYTKIWYEIEGLEIKIFIEVKTVYKTGVEVEAMHGASIIALTMYDMLKPIDKGIEIGSIRLLNKKGGKSDYKNKLSYSAAVIVCSDSIASGKGEDTAGKRIIELLEPMQIETKLYKTIPDDRYEVENAVLDNECDILIFCGGTGLSSRDITPETILPLLDKEISGVMEWARTYGQQRIPFAMLSRSLAGVRGGSLILSFPGSKKAAEEYVQALFPHILHVFDVLKGLRH